MKFEKSCGAIVFRRDGNELFFLILQHFAGHWSFPKGHVEDKESEVETAIREIREETGLEVTIDPFFREINLYSPGFNINKEVIYFVAESTVSNVQLQESEIKSKKWCNHSEALQLLTYNSDKALLDKANDYILKSRFNRRY